MTGVVATPPMVMLKLTAGLVPEPLVAVMLNALVPAVVGVPEINPLVALRLKPAGNVPVLTA